MAFTRLEPTGVNTSATFTFANANVTTNLNVGGVSNLGPVGNIIITGGTSGQVLSTNGSGGLSWTDQTGGGGGTNYSNSNVAAYLPTFTGNFTAGNISSTGNITAAYFIGDGSQLTGLPSAYSNTNVASYLPTYTGNFTAGKVVAGSMEVTTSSNFISGVTANRGLIGVSTSTGASDFIFSSVGPNNTIGGGFKFVSFNKIGYSTEMGIDSGGNLLVKSTSDSTSTSTGAAQISGGLGVVKNVYVGGNVTANYFIGNGSTLTSITGGNVTGQVANALIAGTVYTNAQPNITSVGTLASLNVTANVSAGNILTNNLLYANGVAWNFGSGGGTNYSNANVAAYLPTYTGNITAGNVSATVDIIGGNIRSTNSQGDEGGEMLLAKPQTNSTIAGTGVTIDIYQNRLRFFEQGGSARGAFIDITAAAAGVGSNLLAGGGGTTNPAGANTQIQFNNLGSFGADANFTYNFGTDTLGVKNVTMESTGALSGGNSISATYVVGNGSLLTNLTGANVTGQVSNALIAGTVYSNAQPNITSVGVLASLNVTANVSAGNVLTNNLLYANGVAWSFSSGSNYSNANVAAYLPTYTGNVSANYFIGNALSIGTGSGGNIVGANLISANFFQGNGSLLSSVTGANVTGQVSNALIAGTVYSNAQPNITSVGTLVNLNVTANVSAGNILTNNLLYANGIAWSFGSTYSNTNVAAYLPTYTGNVNAAYFIGNGSTLSSITGGNVSGQVGNALVAGTVYTAAQPSITSVGTLTSLSVTGLTTATGGVRTGNIQDSLGTNTISVSASTVGVIGNLTVGTGGAGNVTATNFIGNGATLTNITGANVIGTVSSATTATTAGTVTTNAQPNITSTGTLNSVTATGTVNFIGASNVSLGPVGNVKITGGSANFVLSTDGAGTLSWVAQSGGGGGGGGSSISNGTSNVNIATSGGNVTTSVGGNANIFVVTSTGANINGNLAITGSVSAGLGSGGSLSGANSISANYFIGNGSLLTGIITSTINYYSRNYYWAGPVTVNTGTTRLYLPLNSTLVNAYFNLATAGTSNTVVATERNGVIIANTTLGSNVSNTFTTFNTSMSINDYLTVDVTTAGASAVDLYITYVFTTT